MTHILLEHPSRGMTLIETLVAVTILTVAIVAPMQLTISSLASANYARDQILAANLAQEAIESVRSKRDGNILTLALTANATCLADGLPMHILCGIPIGQDFTIDTASNNTITVCSGSCPYLKTDSAQTLYGYNASWTTETSYRRVVHVVYLNAPQSSVDEIKITVTVTQKPTAHQLPPMVISENMYRWLDIGSII